MREIRFTQTCDITRNPTAGSTGVTAVVSNLDCTVLYPADEKAMRLYNLGSTVRKFTLFTAVHNGVQDGDIVTIGDKTYSIEGSQLWPSRNGRSAFLAMVVELQR